MLDDKAKTQKKKKGKTQKERWIDLTMRVEWCNAAGLSLDRKGGGVGRIEPH